MVCNTPSTWLPSGRQVEDRSRASHAAKHLVCARRVRVGPFQAVKAAPRSPSPGPSLVIALAVAPGGSQHVPSSLGAWRQLKS